MGGEQTLFGGYGFAIRHFHVAGTELKVERRWSRSRIGEDASPEFSITITGIASGEDDVRVIGGEERSRTFSLAIRSDAKAKEHWETIKRLDKLVAGEGADTPERRLWTHRNEELDASPPTASLFMTSDDRESGVAGGWALECQVSQDVLDRLITDVMDGRASTVRIGINWVAGLVEDKYAPQRYATTWGLFKLSDESAPEPLWGHVTQFAWTPTTVAEAREKPVHDELERAREEWMKSFKARRKDEDERWMERSEAALSAVTGAIAEWCANQGESAAKLTHLCNNAQWFLQRLDDALHRDKGPLADERYALWRHYRLSALVRKAGAASHGLVDDDELLRLTREYLANPWLHHPYLHWVLLDASTAAKTLTAYSGQLGHGYTLAYLFGGVSEGRVALLKAGGTLMLWGLPAVACYFVAQRSVELAVVVGVLWYGLNLVGVVRHAWRELLDMLAHRPTPRLEFEAVEDVHRMLAGPALHLNAVRGAFERAERKGVIWDQQVYYLLDSLMGRKLGIWESVIGR